MPLTTEAFGLTDVGRKRQHNEDAMLVDAPLGLFIVADGMGGHAAGEVASTTVINAIERLDEDRPVEDLLGDLRTAFEQANRDVANAVDADLLQPSCRSCSTSYARSCTCHSSMSRILLYGGSSSPLQC